MPWPERVALVHDRLDQNGGAERVLWALHELFPEAPILTAMWNRRVVPQFQGCDVRTSWMQRLPGIEARPRAYAAVYPLAFAGLDLREYDLVISSSSSFAKGIRRAPGAQHVCYCHSPANFLWRPEAYFPNRISRSLSWPLRAWLRRWELWAMRQPDVYVANGRAVADRIEAYYGVRAEVVHPPIDERWFSFERSPSDFLLVVARLVEQKRVDIAIEAAQRLGRRLIVVGDGRQVDLKRRWSGPTVEFAGRVSEEELGRLYATARALVVPAEEDFGMAALEAQATGTPVVAYDAGGARETVIDGVTGVRFRPQSVEGLVSALSALESLDLDPERIRAHARRFSNEAFSEAIRGLLDRLSPAGSKVPHGETAWQS